MHFSGLGCYSVTSYIAAVMAQETSNGETDDDRNLPRIYDSKLHAQVVAEGLELPTNMAFLGPDDILVLEKNKGTVQRIVNGKMLSEPLLDVNVNGENERGMVGIAISMSVPEHTYVFLYYTEAEGEDDGEPLGNRLYRYELINNKLLNPLLILDLKIKTLDFHNGGTILIGRDNNVYLMAGSVSSDRPHSADTAAMNVEDDPDGRSGILRFTLDGKPVGKGILGDEYPLNLYFAYGIRNGFGMDFDPITGNLWDTENGGSFGDEINLVEPGFNSGWKKLQGMWSQKEDSRKGEIIKPDDIVKLVSFRGKGNYSSPEFVWDNPVGVTAIRFLNSDIYGKEYQNDIFVSDIIFGNLYHFDLDQDRTKLVLNSTLDDKIADNYEELKGITFGEGFGSTGQEGFIGISDLEVGPHDGYLYVLSYSQGKIFKIVPNV